MSEHRPFDKDPSRTSDRRKEWVSLDRGDVCIWEHTVAETMQLAEHARRPAIDPRGGMDASESMLWQILLSCYDGDGDDARRVFNETNRQDIQLIYDLRQEEYLRLLAAMNRVNGADATEEELLRDFTEARQGAASLP